MDDLYPVKVQESFMRDENRLFNNPDAGSIARLEKSMNSVVKVFMGLGERIQVLEAIVQNQVTVSGTEAKALASAVRMRAMEYCDRAGVSYRLAGRKVRKAIWRDFLTEYSIPTYHDLPRHSFTSGLDYIASWTSYAMSKKLAQLFKGGAWHG